jgi:hypothetical protein
MAYFSIFGNVSKSILVMIPKYDLTFMICSPITQIHKNNPDQEAIGLEGPKTAQQYQILET